MLVCYRFVCHAIVTVPLSLLDSIPLLIVKMEYDNEDLYENVIFRGSRIVYPPDLVTAVEDESHAESFILPVLPVRHSVLQAFDPVMQRQSVGVDRDKLNIDLLLLNNIEFTLESPPPPIPPRNASCRVGVHSYDPVAIEDGKVSVLSTKVSKKEEKPASQATGDCGSSVSDEDEFPACPSTPSKSSTKVRGLLNRVSSKEWLTGLKKLSKETSTLKTESSQRDLRTNMGEDYFTGHGGMLHWNVSNRKDVQYLWTEIKKSQIISYVAQSSGGPVNNIHLEKLISIGLTETGPIPDVYQFELALIGEKNKTILSSATIKERSKWMEWILQGSTSAFGPELRKCYIRAGKVSIKEGISGEWQTAWMLLQSESKRLWIQYLSANKSSSEATCQDLRKVRSATQMKRPDSAGSLATHDSPIIVNWAHKTLYIESDLASETENWLEVLRAVALQSGCHLQDYQLTADDVPVLVECCIKFIETYGMLSEGIYRRSGVQSKINRLLNNLKTDAWNQHISIEEFTEHDVANVLKRFFRTLPEPLLTNELYSQWIDGLAFESHDEQLNLYKRLLRSLPQINRQTLNKLLGHLHAVQNKCEKNLMSVSNLAALWGPNLMTVESARDHTSNFR